MTSMVAERPAEDTLQRARVDGGSALVPLMIKIGRPCPRSETPLARAAAEAQKWNIAWPTLDVAELENNVGTPLSLPVEVALPVGK